jgi:hypothetical protein
MCSDLVFPDRRIDAQYRFPADTSNIIGCCGAPPDDVDVYEHRAASVVFYYACQPAIPPGVTRKA